MQTSIMMMFVYLGESSIIGACAVGYAVVFKPNGTQKNIIASLCHIAKKKLSIPRLN